MTPHQDGSRAGQTIEHRRGVDAELAGQIRAIVESARAADGVGPLSGHFLDALDRGAPDTELLLAIDSGRLAGLAVYAGGDPAEVVVDPGLRGRGIGRRLVTAALREAGRVWAHGDLAAAGALAARMSLTPVRTLLQMRRTLPAAGVDAPVPAGVRIRTFVPGADDEQFLGVNARAFAWHPEQGRLDAAGLADEMAQDWFDPGGFFLAVTGDGDAERMLGFHWTKVHPIDPTPQASLQPDGPEPLGEVYVIGVDPRSPVRGLGGPLTAVGLEHLTAAGLREVMLYVEGDNEPALRLYRRWGFQVAVTDVVYTAGVSSV